METDNESENKKVQKMPLLKWNGEVNSGNLLTILVVVIASFGLYYQKRAVETKVDDLQAVVAKLEEEKLNRELQGLQGEEKMLNSFSYNLRYTIDQLRMTGQISDYEFMFMHTEFNELIDLFLKRKDLTLLERRKLELLKARNINKQEVFAHGDIYTKRNLEFEEKNSPKRENYKTILEFNAAQSIYIDTLEKHINFMKHLLDSFLKEPVRKVKENEIQYLNLRDKK
jgi:hypothetical protein